jgi:ABC transporter substrate binding protein
MRRREFITLASGAAIAWPLVAYAQQSTIPVIGFLRTTSLAVSTPMVTGFRQGLTAVGFTEGQNVAIEYRFADSQRERLPGLVAELIRLPVAVIVANNIAALAAKAATTTVPIVFATGSDPVVDGLVASLNRPGGNITGVFLDFPDFTAKWIDDAGREQSKALARCDTMGSRHGTRAGGGGPEGGRNAERPNGYYRGTATVGF